MRKGEIAKWKKQYWKDHPRKTYHYIKSEERKFIKQNNLFWKKYACSTLLELVRRQEDDMYHINFESFIEANMSKEVREEQHIQLEAYSIIDKKYESYYNYNLLSLGDDMDAVDEEYEKFYKELRKKTMNIFRKKPIEFFKDVVSGKINPKIDFSDEFYEYNKDHLIKEDMIEYRKRKIKKLNEYN